MNFKPLDIRAPWELKVLATGKPIIIAGAYTLARFTEHATDAEMRLVIAAVGAAREINPDNPIAAAEAMPEIWRLMREVVAASQRICPPFDSERWLREVEAVVLKAMAGE